MKTGRVDFEDSRDADAVQNRFDPSAFARGGIVRFHAFPPMIAGCCAFGISRADEKLPKCPHCDTTLKPERIGAGRFTCPCCSRVWTAGPPPKE